MRKQVASLSLGGGTQAETMTLTLRPEDIVPVNGGFLAIFESIGPLVEDGRMPMVHLFLLLTVHGRRNRVCKEQGGFYNSLQYKNLVDPACWRDVGGGGSRTCQKHIQPRSRLCHCVQ